MSTRYISAQFLISMTDELWHIKLAPATITSWYLIRSMKQLRRILMHILYSIVTVDSSIQVSTFGQSWTPQRWCRVCPELDGVLTMVRWKDSGEFWNPRCTIWENFLASRHWLPPSKNISIFIIPSGTRSAFIAWHLWSFTLLHKKMVSANAETISNKTFFSFSLSTWQGGLHFPAAG